MDFENLVNARYSCRKFDSRPVEKEKVDKILEICRQAPSAVNYQPHRILVLDDSASLAKLKACTKYDFDAPLALLVCCDKEEAWQRRYDGHNSVDVDASIVGTYIMLASYELGLGNTWVMSFDPAEMRKAYNIPEGLEPVALFPLGYPAGDAKPSKLHYERKALGETTLYNSF